MTLYQDQITVVMNGYGDNDFKCGLEADIVNMTLVLFNGQQSVIL